MARSGLEDLFGPIYRSIAIGLILTVWKMRGFGRSLVRLVDGELSRLQYNTPWARFDNVVAMQELAPCEHK